MACFAALAEEILYPLWDWRTASWVLDLDIDSRYLAECRRSTWESDASPADNGRRRAAASAELATARYFLGDLGGARAGFQAAQRHLGRPPADDHSAGNTHGDGPLRDRLRIGAGLVASLARGASRTTLQSSTPEGILRALPVYHGDDAELTFVLAFCQAACLYRIGLVHLATRALRTARHIEVSSPALALALDNLEALLNLSNGNPDAARSLAQGVTDPAGDDGLASAVIHLNLGTAAARQGRLKAAQHEYQTVLNNSRDDSRLLREHADAALNLAVTEAGTAFPDDTIAALYSVLDQLPADSEIQSAHILRHLGECYYQLGARRLASHAYAESSARYIGVSQLDAAARTDHAAGLELERRGHTAEALDRLVPAALVADIRRYALTGADARTLWRESAGTGAMADAMRLAGDAGQDALLADLIVWVRAAGELDLLGDRPAEGQTSGTPWWPSTANSVLKPGPWVVSSSPSALDTYIATACERYLAHWSDFHQGDAIVLQPTPQPRMPVGAASRTRSITLVNRTSQHVRFRSKDTSPIDLGQGSDAIKVEPTESEPFYIEHAGRLVEVTKVSFDIGKKDAALPERREGTWYVVALPVAQMFPERDDFVYPFEVDFKANWAGGLGRISDDPDSGRATASL